MKRLRVYEALDLHDEDAVFGYLMSTFHDNLRHWDYFVNWAKVFKNVDALDEQFDRWDVLIGSEDFDSDFRSLMASNPELGTTIPLLVVRDGSGTNQFSIVAETDVSDWRAGLRYFDFSTPTTTEAQIEMALEFVTRTGVKRLFESSLISRTRDYLLGTEAGLDSNGRKNRGGYAMSTIVGRILSDLSAQAGFEFGHEMNSAAIANTWGIKLNGIGEGRRFDFVVNAQGRLFAIEVNAYGGGGSKLKATAGEYVGLQKDLEGSPLTFIWITEGAGWRTSHRPLRKAFESIDYVLNLRLIQEGALEEIIART